VTNLVTENYVSTVLRPSDRYSYRKLRSDNFVSKKIVTENDNTDVVRLQIESHTLQAGAELNHLLGLKKDERFLSPTSANFFNIEFSSFLIKH
jgi:hypothetical protein